MKFAVIGAGSGGQCMAAHLTYLGHQVTLHDIDEKKISALREKGSVELKNKLTCEVKIDRITTDTAQAVAGADIIMVVTTTDAHAAVAASIAPYIKASQTIILNPGHCGGVLEFKAVLMKNGCAALPKLAECPTLIYGCRQEAVGRIFVTGIKKKVLMAALPSADTAFVLSRINPVYPQFQAAGSVLETSMSVSGCLMHVIPTLMNATRIDSGISFDYYMEGITPHVAELMEYADQERVSVASALGVEVKNLRAWLKDSYNLEPDTLYNMLQANEAYRGARNPKNFDHRFVMEDVTGGFVPLAAFGDICGVDTPVIDLFIRLAALICGKDFRKLGRTAENLGLVGKSAEEVIRLLTE